MVATRGIMAALPGGKGGEENARFFASLNMTTNSRARSTRHFRVRKTDPTFLLKSPFPKGGFRGIIRRLHNPPCPPLKKGGKILGLIGGFF